MAALITTDFQIPNNIAKGIFKKAQTGSALAQLSGARPQKFGTETNWVLTAAPKAEIVGEGSTKSPTPTTYAPKRSKCLAEARRMPEMAKASVPIKSKT